MQITTNNQPRLIIEAYELTLKERKEFDYLDWPSFEQGKDSRSFMRYKGQVYDLSELESAPDSLRELGWHDYQPDSFFSGIVLRWLGSDFDHVIVGRYST